MPKQVKENNVIYTGVSRWQNVDTGEVIETNDVVKKVDRNGFMITYLETIVNLIDVLGNKKMAVVKYILNNMDKSTNTLIITTTELSEKAEVSRQVVSDTLKILTNAKIITRRTGAVMIHPSLIHRGNVQKEKMLLTRFQDFGDEVKEVDDEVTSK